MASSKRCFVGLLPLVVVLLLFAVLTSAAGPARRRPKPPLIEDTSRKRPPRPSHCQFGNQTHEIEDRWRPNLGPPFGVLVCVRCECQAVQRKNRMISRVRCKNIKNDCPKPNCDNPVLLPERCCKTCPGEGYANVEEELVIRKSDHEDADEGKEFSVLMTGKGLQPPVSTDFTARGYFSFAKRNLQYFINYVGTEQPSFIRFMDAIDGNILEEHELAASESQENATKTVCGIWKKVPRVYRALLRKGRLHVVVTTPRRPEGVVGGKLMKNDLLHTEVYSALIPGAASGKAGSAGAGSGGGSAFPATCLLRQQKENANALQKSTNFLDDEANDIVGGSSTHKCYYEGEIFDDGSQWKAQHMTCSMCSCQKGRIKCDSLVCPATDCEEPQTLPGECCPTCNATPTTVNNNTSKPRGCYFEGDKKLHLAGTKWHPYLPPFGFDKCSLCTCSADTLRIECKRSITCPPLTCDEDEAFRENPMDCCKRCPNVLPVKAMNTDQLGDQRVTSVNMGKSYNELLEDGGCSVNGRVMPNGDEWNPTVQPFGVMKFVKCNCKDKHVSCRRITRSSS